MALVGVAITKSTPYRGAVQEFTNVYHYKWIGNNPTSGEADSLIDAIVTIEKTFHATSVNFVRAKCWSAGGTKAENNMISQKLLSGAGTATIVANYDRERAILIQWPAGLDSRGHPVTLKKWFHVMGVFSTVSFSAAMFEQLAELGSNNRTLYNNKGDALGTISFAGVTGARLCGPRGREQTGAATTHKYLEHHQLGDMWR